MSAPTRHPVRPDLPSRVLVLGFARTGQAVARILSARGVEVTACDDRRAVGAAGVAADLGVRLVEAPELEDLASLVEDAEFVVVSPGIPPSHPVFRLGPDKVISEVELAARLTDVPIVAVTGTNGKTTVTTLVAAMLAQSGRTTLAAGNIGVPLVEVVERPGLDVIVAEVSSFQLAYTSTLRPSVATWLNFAEDHLDWHRDLDEYADAKARIWRNQQADDVAVANAEDPVVLSRVAEGRARLVTFGLARGQWREVGGRLVSPEGETLVALDELRRALPHDRANALAAAATAVAAGAGLEDCRRALRVFEQLPHRLALVGSAAGVSYYDDSKATTPAAVCAALAGFPSVVLCAGGRNKGLDLGLIRRFLEVPPVGVQPAWVRAVVAFGEAAEAVEAAFSGLCPVVVAASMSEVVTSAAHLAEPGDAVLLSPGCASFDWYGSYGERGDDFARVVRTLMRPAALGEASR